MYYTCEVTLGGRTLSTPVLYNIICKSTSAALDNIWFLSVLWHCWFGHLACKNSPRNDL